MTDDESINELAEQKREEAFVAAPWYWREVPLHPLSIGREGDWLIHCHRIGLPPLDEVINKREAFFGHALRMVWFCAHESSVWLSMWMKGRDAAPIIMEGEISEWLDKHVLPGEQMALLDLAYEIFDRSRATRAKRVEDGADEAGEGSGLAPALNTSASSARPSTAPVPTTTSNTNSAKRRAGRSSTVTDARKAKSTNGRMKWQKKKARSEKG
jgi:hypothetical protein